jgi:hypothetical protein
MLHRGSYCSSPLTYSRLLEGEIRLLRLDPGKDTEPLSAHLETWPLHDHEGGPYQKYDALSYVWGEVRSEYGQMDVDGHSFNITTAVAHALARLRFAAAPRLVWVDFICINQEGLEERAEQVSVMAEIFGSAQRTCVHLGSFTPEIASGFRTLEILRSRPITGWSEIWDHPPPLVCAGIRDLMRRPWWGRTWCVQEAVVAKEVVLLCGDHSLTWSTSGREVYRFLRSLKAAVLSPQWEQFDVGSTCFEPLIELLRTQLANGPDRDTWSEADQTPDLLDVAYDMRHRLSTELRDRFFGVLSLAKGIGHGAANLETLVDYTKTHVEVFTEITSLVLPRDPFIGAQDMPTPESDSVSTSATLQGTATSYIPADPKCSRKDRPRCDSPVSRLDNLVNLSVRLAAYVQRDDQASDSRSISQIEVEIMKGMAAINLGQKQHAAKIFTRLGRDLREESDEIASTFL